MNRIILQHRRHAVKVYFDLALLILCQYNGVARFENLIRPTLKKFARLLRANLPARNYNPRKARFFLSRFRACRALNASWNEVALKKIDLSQQYVVQNLSTQVHWNSVRFSKRCWLPAVFVSPFACDDSPRTYTVCRRWKNCILHRRRNVRSNLLKLIRFASSTILLAHRRISIS